VAGSLNAFQLEAGAFGTSLIVTAGGTAARATDLVTITGAAATVISGAAMSVIQSIGVTPNHNQAFIAFNSGVGLSNSSSTSNLSTFPADLSATLGSGGWYTTGGKLGYSQLTAGGRSAVANNGTVVTSATVPPAFSPAFYQLGGFNGTTQIDAYVTRLTLFSSKISDASLKGLTQ
jgi:hypothetical protein